MDAKLPLPLLVAKLPAGQNTGDWLCQCGMYNYTERVQCFNHNCRQAVHPSFYRNTGGGGGYDGGHRGGYGGNRVAVHGGGGGDGDGRSGGHGVLGVMGGSGIGKVTKKEKKRKMTEQEALRLVGAVPRADPVIAQAKAFIMKRLTQNRADLKEKRRAFYAKDAEFGRLIAVDETIVAMELTVEQARSILATNVEIKEEH